MTILWDYSTWTWSKKKLKKQYVCRKVLTYFFLFSNHNVQILDLSHLTIFFQGSVAPALFGRSALTVKGSLGETAVGFDFAPPTISTSVSAGEEPSTNPTVYPVFILWGDGRIFFVATTIGKVIHPKCFLKTDQWPYLLPATMKCGCRKLLNHGSNNELFLPLFKDLGKSIF